MLFTSVNFLLFFAVVFTVYWLLRPQGRSFFLLLASYIFYASWDFRFCFLLLFTTVGSYCFSYLLWKASGRSRNLWLWVCLTFLISQLVFLKYLNFFLNSLARLFASEFIFSHSHLLSLALPLGISFYTFKAMSYCLDIYRGATQPCSFKNYALYLAFFPQIIAGPIDRSTPFISQLLTPPKLALNMLSEGGFLFCLGFFQKVFIADNLQPLVDPFFASAVNLQRGSLFCLYAYAFQLYFDFCGYSYMAWGVAKLLGFDTTHNFNFPLLSTNIQNFWNRWHISLSLWIRDYVYTPLFLGAKKLSTSGRLYWATFVSMFLIGLWHGAGLHFILYGVYHGVLLCLYAAAKPFLQNWTQNCSKRTLYYWNIFRIFLTFHFVASGFLIFRAPSCTYLLKVVESFFVISSFYLSPSLILNLAFYASIGILLEFLQWSRNDRFVLFRFNPLFRAALYIACFFLVTLHGPTQTAEFIYFQF